MDISDEEEYKTISKKSSRRKRRVIVSDESSNEDTARVTTRNTRRCKKKSAGKRSRKRRLSPPTEDSESAAEMMVPASKFQKLEPDSTMQVPIGKGGTLVHVRVIQKKQTKKRMEVSMECQLSAVATLSVDEDGDQDVEDRDIDNEPELVFKFYYGRRVCWQSILFCSFNWLKTQICTPSTRWNVVSLFQSTKRCWNFNMTRGWLGRRRGRSKESLQRTVLIAVPRMTTRKVLTTKRWVRSQQEWWRSRTGRQQGMSGWATGDHNSWELGWTRTMGNGLWWGPQHMNLYLQQILTSCALWRYALSDISKYHLSTSWNTRMADMIRV